MRKLYPLMLCFCVMICTAQNNNRLAGNQPIPLSAFSSFKNFERSTRYPVELSRTKHSSNSRSQNISFYMDYGLLDSFYNIYGPNNGGGTWYQDDQYAFRLINSSLPVDSVNYMKYGFTWFPTIVDFVNNPNWPFNEYPPNDIQMTIDTVYVTLGHVHVSNLNDTITVSIWDYDSFQSFVFDSGAAGGGTTLLGQTRLIVDSSLLGGTGEGTEPGTFQLGTYPFSFANNPVVVPQGHRFIIQLNFNAPWNDQFLLSSARRNDCASTCGASIPNINATLGSVNNEVDSFNSLYGIRYVGGIGAGDTGVFPSPFFFNDCNGDGVKDDCELLYTQDFDIYPNIKAYIPAFFASITPDTMYACTNSNVNLTMYTAGSAALPYTITWNSDGGIFSNNTGQQTTLTTPAYQTTVTVTGTVTDANNISITDTGYVVVNTGAACSTVFAVSLGQNQNVCTDNTVTLNPVVYNGYPPYNYSWSSTGDPLSCTQCQYPNVTITQNSQFYVTVTDAQNNSGIATVSYTPIGTGSVQISVVNTNISCSILVDTTTVTVTSGHAPYTFNWSYTSAPTPGNSPASNIYTSPGIYVITVTDAAGCLATDIDTILNDGVDAKLLVEVAPNCTGDYTGKVVVAGTGGTSPYTFAWSNGTFIDSIANVAGGIYAVTVSDVNHCTGQETYYLSPKDGYYYTYLQETDANCSNNGSVIPLIYGGRQPYSFLWNNGSTASKLTGLGFGFYSVTVTDSLGCVTTGSAFVNSNCYGIISGVVFTDLNNNCIYSGNDQPVPNIIVDANQNGLDYYGYTDENGQYVINVNGSGSFTLNFYAYYACNVGSLCGNSSQIVTLSNPGDSSTNNNFGMNSTSGFDIGLHPGWSSADPGFQKEYWILWYNATLINFDEVATIIFVYDSNLTYQYSLPPLPVHDPVAHTLIWQIDSIPAGYWDWDTRLQNFFMVPSSLSLNYLLQSDFTITPIAGDCDPSDNHLHFSEVVTGSHDPNEKTVSPAHYVENDSVLTYTIHFQNNGTDSTNFIIVLDTLSPELNPATVRTIASSYANYQFSISGPGILKWVFNPYRLVDSLTNPGGSKGFVMFTVEPNSNRQAGAVISNRASIYFDYNSPVMTNTVTDTVTFTGIVNIPANGQPSLSVFPNPSSDKLNITVIGFIPQYLSLYDMDGRKLSEQKFVQQIDISALPAGVYFIEVSGENTVVRNKVGKISGE